MVKVKNKVMRSSTESDVNPPESIVELWQDLEEPNMTEIDLTEDAILQFGTFLTTVDPFCVFHSVWRSLKEMEANIEIQEDDWALNFVFD